MSHLIEVLCISRAAPYLAYQTPGCTKFIHNMSLFVCMNGTTEWAEIVSLIFYFTFSSWLYSSGHIGTHMVEGLLQYSLHCTSLRIEYCSVITSDYTKNILHFDLVWQWGLNIVCWKTFETKLWKISDFWNNYFTWKSNASGHCCCKINKVL